MLEKLTSCPLGHECERAVEGKLITCAWLLDVKGIDPQTGESIDKKMCAVVAAPLMSMDITKAVYGNSQAVSTQSSLLSKVITSGKKELTHN